MRSLWLGRKALPLYAGLIVLTASWLCLSQDGKLGQGRPPMQIPSTSRELVTEVSGGYEAQYFFSRLDKPAAWEQDLEAVCQLKVRAVSQAIERLEANLAGLKTQQLEDRHYDVAAGRHHTVAQLYAYQGDLQKAIGHFKAAQQIAAAHGMKDFQLELEEKLGITEMRRGEVENCVMNHRAGSCIFPISPEGQHHYSSGSRAAIQHFSRYLEQKPGDLEVRWLLNIAYMTLGEYPRTVPKGQLIAPSVFESGEDVGQFVDVAPALGIDYLDPAGGAIMDDFDNDGFLDLITSSLEACAPLHYFHNNGDGAFTDLTSRAGLSKQLGGLNIVQTDYNNDGWIDVYVLRGGWELPERNSLLRNNGDNTFTDVTLQAGLAIPATATQTGAWADFDNDGNIDLFVGNETSPSQLFRNNGNGNA